WRVLKKRADVSNTSEEAIFTMQGILTLKDMPPILEKPRISHQRIKYLHQSITLSGLGSPTFEQVILAAQEIYGHFDRQFTEGTLESWNNSPENSMALNISNRYLTPQTEAGAQPSIPFFKGVDPRNILKNLSRGDLSQAHIHTEDNQVQYFVLHRGRAGECKYEECEPQQFRIGDIVQVQMSFVAVPIKGGMHKMLTVLRLIALLDGSFTTVSNIKSTIHMKN
ncbi:hypothetical protein L208DRAFT_1336227, partial [Tricholoma matsutake]